MQRVCFSENLKRADKILHQYC